MFPSSRIINNSTATEDSVSEFESSSTAQDAFEEFFDFDAYEATSSNSPDMNPAQTIADKVFTTHRRYSSNGFRRWANGLNQRSEPYHGDAQFGSYQVTLTQKGKDKNLWVSITKPRSYCFAAKSYKSSNARPMIFCPSDESGGLEQQDISVIMTNTSQLD
ncbi:hypothetical protein M434DRAFT_32396 [Hypoxylon sp. CO27-5]|nr:hypothetical protein M434DRAFT_32396 [Hypoxylon sp. CO27-5]